MMTVLQRALIARLACERMRAETTIFGADFHEFSSKIDEFSSKIDIQRAPENAAFGDETSISPHLKR